MYALYRTYVSARSASGTLIIIYRRKVIHNGDSTLRAGLLTLHTADTAVHTRLASLSALIVI